MRTVYTRLSEKDRRLYAAIEARKLPHGGMSYIAKVVGCTRKTVRRGLKELQAPRTVPNDRIRQKGGGAKRKLETIPGLDAAFLEIMDVYTAGDPMRDDVLWTNLARTEIAAQLQARGLPVGPRIVGQLLSKHNFKQRKTQKRLSTGSFDARDAQFQQIKMLREAYEAAGEPVLSMDTKKKSI